jgi:3',5'-nucleoside bisphosphate phosphatase
MSKIDLHLHTTCSDGTLTPEATVAAAQALGVLIIGIADHDTLLGIEPAQQAAVDTDVRVVPGIELNTDYNGAEIHILGYGFTSDAPAIRTALTAMQNGRKNRNQDILDRLRELGMPLHMEQIVQIAQGEVVARPHIAKAMLQAGYVETFQEAFDKYLAKGAAAFRERHSLTPQQACIAVRESGGLPVLAHPGKFAYEPLLAELMPCGLRGMEVYHPDHSAAQKRRLLHHAQSLGLVITGGSDSHGPTSGRPQPIGAGNIPAHIGPTFLAALEKMR